MNPSIVRLSGLLVGVVVSANLHAAGELDPPGGPEPTMHSLEEIYQKLGVLEQRLNDLELRQVADGKFVTSGGMALVPGGVFLMGATTGSGHESIPDAVPQHAVTEDAYYIDKAEISKALWDDVYIWALTKGYAFSGPGAAKDATHPVYSVNWYDAVKWCNARSERDGFTPCYTLAGGVYRSGQIDGVQCEWTATGYRLPTEAEWEKAARGGASGRRFPWSDANTIQHGRANYVATSLFDYDTSTSLNHHPAYKVDPEPYTSPAASFAPNDYGLHDMAGNLWEWCWDWYDLGSGYYASSPPSNPTGPTMGDPALRVMRGGAYNIVAEYARCAARNATPPGSGDQSIGFRTVRNP